ncbi:putative membrane protein [Orenia metallireducens]|uniref:Putative membrane protein n=1 Tax=Orenia metallireducens TaxID=1413210 RepID=A0A285H4V1_9FIRM|nr:putative membrane protein [Orenia metallireducens]SNY30792.1 putative membrane protein [Orenia metallireducens]
MKAIARLLITMLALILTAKIVPGIVIGSLGAGFWAALILGLVNTFIKPVFTLLTLPLTILSFGLFLFVINGLMLLITASLVANFHVSGLLAAIFGSIILSIINSFMLDVLYD